MNSEQLREVVKATARSTKWGRVNGKRNGFPRVDFMRGGKVWKDHFSRHEARITGQAVVTTSFLDGKVSGYCADGSTFCH
jgi:hypothetical protein